METPIKIKYQLTKKDYVVGLRLFNTKTPLAWVAYLIVGAVLTYFALTMRTQDTFLTLIIILAIPLMALNTFVLRPYSYGQQASKDENLTASIRMTIAEDGIGIYRMHKNQQIDWKNFEELIEGKDYFLLKTVLHRNSFDIIPKRAFETPEEEDAFRELATRKIKEV